MSPAVIKCYEMVGQAKARPPTYWDHITVALAEFLGTTTLVLLSCMGTCTGIQGNVSSMHTSFAAGLAVTAVIQIFGHISGAHVNPAVSLNALLVNKIGWSLLPSYVVPQVLGSLSGAAIFAAVTNEDSTQIELGSSGLCVNAINDNISPFQGLVVEVLLSIVLNLANCASWDARNSDKLDSVSLKIGLLVVVLNLGGAAYTGASMNPSRSFGPAVVSGDYKNHWIYWTGPITGSLIAAIIYKFVFLKNK